MANREKAIEFLQIVVIYTSNAAKDLDITQVSNAIDAAFKDGGDVMGGFVQELIEQGKQEGQQQALRNTILDTLRLRFDAAPPSISNRLNKIDDLETLRELNRQAVTADSLTTFEQYLETL